MRTLLQIPCWTDNYTYLAIEGARAFVVDPTDADTVLGVLKARGLTLKAILNTHHHPDHVGGNLELQKKTGCITYGAAHDLHRIPGVTHPVSPGDVIDVLGFSLRILDVRAHTLGHIAYACDTPFERVVRHGHQGEAAPIERLANSPALFVGDAMFMAGCGRLFEGSAAQLARSFETLLREDDDALVVCAHEYTEGNLKFAAHALRESSALDDVQKRLSDLSAERRLTGSSVPDVLGREKKTNPFALALDPAFGDEIATALGTTKDKAELIGALRKAKDSF